MWHRASRERPLCDHGAFFEVYDGNMAFPVHNISHGTYNFFAEGSMVIPAGSPPGSLMLLTSLAVSVSTMSMEA